MAEIDAETVLFNHEGVINEMFTEDSSIIDYALNFIGDRIDNSSSFRLNKEKIVKSVALAILYVKGDNWLSEYVSALRSVIELALPASMQQPSAD